MTENIDKVISYRDAYGKPTTNFYSKEKEIEIGKLNLDKKLQELVEVNSEMIKANPKIMRIISKI